MYRVFIVIPVVVLAMLVLFAQPLWAAVYVKWDSPNDGPGNDWDHAFHSVQAGVDAAGSGGEVWVAAGWYFETITLEEGTGLYGGFAGTETTRNERNWAVNITTLDGDMEGSVVTSPAGATASTTIDGFTIRYGYADRGGGIYCGCCSPTISNNRITANYATGGGSGIYCDTGSPTIVNNVITYNGANIDPGDGGGIAYVASTPIIANNTIAGNKGARGGGVYCSDPPSPGGGLVGSSEGCGQALSESTLICNNTIVENTAPFGGGGIYCCEDSSPAVTNNIIAGNSSGIRNEGGTPVLRTNCVWGNMGYNYSGLSPGAGDISSNPVLVDPNGGDYHLMPMSPCINAGSNDAPGLPLFDMDGEGRIFGAVVDIGADEFWSSTMSVPDAKRAPDGAAISGDGAIVSAAFTDFFYVEADDRACGIRVGKAGHGLSAGMRAGIAGTVRTNSDGERYVDADSAVQSGSGGIRPLMLTNRRTGGGDWNYDPATGAGQKGVSPGSGLNNIGLLITATGRVTHSETGFFYIDDGSALDDGSGQIGVKVDATGLTVPGESTYVEVTGISSCFQDGADLYRLIRATEIAVLQ